MTVPAETALDPHRSVHVGIWRDEHDEITRRFYRWDVPELPVDVRAAIGAGVRDDVAGLGLTFHDPADVALTPSVIARGGIGTAVCAVVADSGRGHELAHLVHAVHPTPWGSVMRSRFVLPAGTPDPLAGAMIDHCWTEMTHLAGFLPHLFVTITGPR